MHTANNYPNFAEPLLNIFVKTVFDNLNRLKMNRNILNMLYRLCLQLIKE